MSVGGRVPTMAATTMLAAARVSEAAVAPRQKRSPRTMAELSLAGRARSTRCHMSTGGATLRAVARPGARGARARASTLGGEGRLGGHALLVGWPGRRRSAEFSTPKALLGRESFGFGEFGRFAWPLLETPTLAWLQVPCGPASSSRCSSGVSIRRANASIGDAFEKGGADHALTVRSSSSARQFCSRPVSPAVTRKGSSGFALRSVEEFSRSSNLIGVGHGAARSQPVDRPVAGDRRDPGHHTCAGRVEVVPALRQMVT